MNQLHIGPEEQKLEVSFMHRMESKVLLLAYVSIMLSLKMVSIYFVVIIVALFKARNIVNTIQKVFSNSFLLGLESLLLLNFFILKTLHGISICTSDIHRAFWAGQEVSIFELLDKLQEQTVRSRPRTSDNKLNTSVVKDLTEHNNNIHTQTCPEVIEIDEDEEANNKTRVSQTFVLDTDRISYKDKEYTLMSSKEAWQNYFHLKKKGIFSSTKRKFEAQKGPKTTL